MLKTPQIVSPQEWDAARRTLLVKEKELGSTWSCLDLTALGRREAWEDSPDGYPQGRPYEWWQRHDECDAGTDPWEGRLDEKIAASSEHARRSAEEA